MKKRRFGLILAVLVLLAGLIAGCANPEPKETYSFQVETGSASVLETEAATEPETAAESEIQFETEPQELEETGEEIPAIGEFIEVMSQEFEEMQEAVDEGDMVTVEEKGTYTTKEEVALYIHTFGKLPSNFITKKKAEDAGWVSSKGNLWQVCPGKSIGGSRFGNYEGQLPEKDGRKYYECDINYNGGKRGAERIVYSNDGLIFYTGDHYDTFEQLY